MGVAKGIRVAMALFALTFGLFLSGQDFGGLSLAAEDAGGFWQPELDFELSYFSKYIDNGFISNPDGNVQGELSISLHGFYVGVASIFDLTGAADYRREFSEWNYFVGYEYEWSDLPYIGSLELGIEWLYEDYPRASEEDVQELCFSIAFNDLLLSPNAELCWQYEDDAFSGSVGIAHSQELATISDRLSWESSLDIIWGNRAWNDGEYGVRRRGASSLLFCSGPLFAFSENLSLGAKLLLGRALGGGVRDAWRDDEWNSASNVAFIIGLNASF